MEMLLYKVSRNHISYLLSCTLKMKDGGVYFFATCFHLDNNEPFFLIVENVLSPVRKD